MWTAAPFVGIQPFGRQLGECRQCSICASTVIRPVSFGQALALLLDDLLSACPPRQCTVQSMMLLAHWAEQYLSTAPGEELPFHESDTTHGHLAG